MKSSALTKRQAEVLAVVIDFLLEHHYAPPLRELGRRVGLTSTHAVHLNLRLIARKGYVLRRPGCSGLTILRWPDGRPFQLRGVCPDEEAPPCESASTT